MRFKIPAGKLKESKFQYLDEVIQSRHVNPILQGILFDVKNNILSLSATDLDVFAIISIDGIEVDQEGGAVITDKIIDVIKSLPDDLDIEFDKKGDRVEIKTSKGKYTFSCFTAEDFPQIFAKDDNMLVKCSISGQVLRDVISSIIYIVPDQHKSYYTSLAGILFDISDSEINFVGSDSYRLIKMTQEVKMLNKVANLSVIVPKDALNILLKFLGDNDIEIELNSRHIIFKSESFTIISRLIDEKYPSYQKILQIDVDKDAIFDRESLLSAIKRVLIFSDKSSMRVNFEFNQDNLVLTANDDSGNSIKENLECIYRSKNFQITFNPKFIYDILRHVKSEKILFKFGRSDQPAYIKPFGDDSDDLITVVMPMKGE